MLITEISSAFAFQVITPRDTTKQVTDTVKKTVETNSFLKEKVIYSATDSMLIDKVNQKAYLYNNASVLYDGLTLKAGYIEIDFGKNLVYATSMKDSAGKDVQKPVFEQGKDKFTAAKIKYDFKTKKGKITDVITQQGEGYIHGRDIKKDSNNVYFVSHGKYTTCDLEHPHYYIGARKIKVIPDDKIITGPALLWIADIPTPLAIPFGYFPNKKGRSSGIIMPTYGESPSTGFFLKGGGFYFGKNEFADLALTGDGYSNGSYGAHAVSNYKKRYRYSGGLNVSYSRLITGDQALPNATTQNDFFIRWNHTQDPKSNPNSRFSANVNAGSSTYNKYNGSVTGDYLSNTFQSNISYSKTFVGTPFNFSANARHSQNTLTKKVDISLPELAFNMNRIYPFKGKKSVGTKWYDKIGISASANARNDIHAYDSTLFHKSTLSQMNNGVHFAVPISTSFNILKYFTLTPTINTGSSIYYETVHKHYDENVNKVFSDTVTGVKMVNDYSLSTGLSTRLYGDYFFKGKRLKQIRHVATPTISASYRPDFSEAKYGYYKKIDGDTSTKPQLYSIFENGIYGPPGAGKSGLIAFALNNSLEAKIRHETDSGKVDKKVPILQSLNVGVSYNVAVKTFNWSTINLSGQTKLFGKLDVRATAVIDPYEIDTAGNKVNKLEWDNGSIGRLTNTGISLSTNLKSLQGKTDPNKPKASKAGSQDELDYINAHPDAYIDFNVPWNFNIYYNLNYSKPGIKETTSQTVTFNGDISLTKKWKISATSGYDFTSKKLTLTSINIYRDLHCWEMRVNVVPFGFRQSFSIDINVKSSVLKDLKLSRRGGYDQSHTSSAY